MARCDKTRQTVFLFSFRFLSPIYLDLPRPVLRSYYARGSIIEREQGISRESNYVCTRFPSRETMASAFEAEAHPQANSQRAKFPPFALLISTFHLYLLFSPHYGVGPCRLSASSTALQ